MSSMHAPRSDYRHDVVPTARDLAIMRLVGERGVVAQECLIAHFWPQSTTPRTAQDRLAQLVAAGFLRCERIASRAREEVVYYLARKGTLRLPETDRHLLITGKPAYGEIAHLLRTGDILDRLHARYTLECWHTERLLRSRTSQGGGRAPVADFSVVLRDPLWGVTAWMVEVDGAYYGARLAKKVAALGQSGDDLLWVVYSPARLAHLGHLAAPFAGIRPVRFEAL